MKCVICKQGVTQPGKVSVTLYRGKATVIFKDVPADVCDNCGEHFLSEKVTEQLMQRAEEAVKKGTEVEILQYAA